MAEHLSPDGRRPPYLGWRAAFSGKGRGMPVIFFEAVLSITAVAGLLISILIGFDIHHWQYSAADFKTLYASSWCFARGVDAYHVPQIAQVFAANAVSLPSTWYAHTPVYPPFTLAIFAPLTLLPMVPSAFVWMALSALSAAVTAVVLMRAAARTYAFPFPARLLIMGLVVAAPMLSFALSFGNVSVPVAALCLCVMFAPEGLLASKKGRWLPAAGLAIALLLKPHMAIWTVVPLLLLPNRPQRRLAVHAILLASAFSLLVLLGMAVTHQLTPQIASYRNMMAAEFQSGSLSPSGHEITAVVAEVCSLAYVLGYWIPVGTGLTVCNLAILAALFLWLLRATLRVNTSADAASSRILCFAAWAAFGFLATYHRAYDGIFLLVFVPWVVHRLWRAPRDWYAWAIAVLYFAMSAGLAKETMQPLVAGSSAHSFRSFLLMRQAGLADLGLLLVLLAAMAQAAPRYTKDTANPPRYEPASGARIGV